jgi:heavy metal-binding protein
MNRATWTVVVATGLLTAGPGGVRHAHAIAQSARAAPTFYCPMHPDVTATSPGACPRCGMAMVAGDPFDLRVYPVDLQLPDGAPRQGAPVTLRFVVRHPSTGEIVREFATVHEKRFHLFVLSHDLEHYDHVHPDQDADGAWTICVTLPKAGYYKLFADFLPAGGSPQVIPKVLATSGFKGDLDSQRAQLTPDTALARTAGSMRVSLTLPSEGLAAGREEKLQYHVVDAATGAPVADIEPYLGAFGHTLVMSEDTLHYVHAHPVELLPDDPSAARGGPDLTFKALLPKPGRYRLWTQIKRSGVVSTVSFTVNAN